MSELIKTLLIVGGYCLIALVVYLILYCKACKNYLTSSYTNLEIYIEREEGYLGLVGVFWPLFMAAAIVVVPIAFIKSKIRKYYGI